MVDYIVIYTASINDAFRIIVCTFNPANCALRVNVKLWFCHFHVKLSLIRSLDLWRFNAYYISFKSKMLMLWYWSPHHSMLLKFLISKFPFACHYSSSVLCTSCSPVIPHLVEFCLTHAIQIFQLLIISMHVNILHDICLYKLLETTMRIYTTMCFPKPLILLRRTIHQYYSLNDSLTKETVFAIQKLIISVQVFLLDKWWRA